MGNRRLTKRVMSGEQKKTEELGSGGRRNNGQIVWQRTVRFFASRGTGAQPHLTLGFGTTQYAKEAAG